MFLVFVCYLDGTETMERPTSSFAKSCFWISAVWLALFRSRSPGFCSAAVRLQFFSSCPPPPPPPSPLSFAHDMVRNRLACTTTCQRTPPPPPHVVLCPLFLLSFCWDKILYGTTAPSKCLFTKCLCWTPALYTASLNRLQDAQGTPQQQGGLFGTCCYVRSTSAFFWFLSAPCGPNASIAAILARIASDLGGSPVVGPSLFKAGIVLSFLAYSFLSSGLGAIEALILSYSLRPRCLLVIFVFFGLFGQAYRTLADARP